MKLDEIGDSIIETFLANEDELLSSHMPLADQPTITDENKYSGQALDLSQYGVVGYPGTFDDAYQKVANDAYEGEITALSQSDGGHWNRKAPVLTDDYRNVLADQTMQERKKVRNILDQFLDVYDVDRRVDIGRQWPNSRVMGRGDFKGSTGANSRYRRSKTYDGEWFRYQGSGYTQMPTEAEQRRAARKGLIVGQLDARYFRGVGSAIDSGGLADAQDTLVHELFESPESPFQEFLPSLATFLTGVEDPEIITRISQLYAPGFPRPGEPFRTQKLFNEIIQQNLLLPLNSADSFAYGNPQNNTPENVFTNTYVKNRSARTFQEHLDKQIEIDAGDGISRTMDLSNFKKGMVGGVPIEDLEYQDGMRLDMRIGGSDERTDVRPFMSYSQDRRKLSQNRKDAGFSHNIPNGAYSKEDTYSPNLNSDFMLGSPAVRSFVGKKSKEEAETLTNHGGESQYFPFCFSTINKNNRYEICYLQGTINSLNEGYNATWSPRSYIGRSEQIHTYTFTDRTIDLSFDVFADTGRMIQNVYERVLWLAQQVYPDYDEKKNLKDGPLLAMRIGDLFPYQEGFIKSLSYDWNFLGAGGKWEMSAGKRMPQGCKVQLSFQPIHRRVPSRDFNFYSSTTQSMGKGFVDIGNFNSDAYNFPVSGEDKGTIEQYYLEDVSSNRETAEGLEEIMATRYASMAQSIDDSYGEGRA
tara:strand:- start:2376 stop:4466 length:2091 start_codon:yes stop_codon:yes gene_type:complete